MWPIVFPSSFLHWSTGRKYSEMFFRLRFWVSAREMMCSMYDHLLQKASPTWRPTKISLFPQQIDRFFELVVKRKLCIPCYLYFYCFHELTHIPPEVGNKKLHSFFQFSQHLFENCRRLPLYSAKVGWTRAWVGRSHYSAPRFLKPIDK